MKFKYTLGMGALLLIQACNFTFLAKVGSAHTFAAWCIGWLMALMLHIFLDEFAARKE